jgi:hypothetical protein
MVFGKGGGLVVDVDRLYPLLDVGPFPTVGFFEVARAGGAAEISLLGHALPNGSYLDYRTWVSWLPMDGTARCPGWPPRNGSVAEMCSPR